MFTIDTPDGPAVVTDIIVEFHTDADGIDKPIFEHYTDIQEARFQRNKWNKGLAVILLEIDHDYPK